MAEVYVSLIKTKGRLRAMSREQVKALAESINAVGLLSPIAVHYRGEEYTLVAGRHRLEAVKLLGWPRIPCVLVDLDENDRRLAEIDENLIRNELTVLERAEHYKERKPLYELKYPETKQGTAGAIASNKAQGKKYANEIISFASDTAKKVGVTPRSVQQDVQIAESLTEEIKEMIRDTPLANQKTALMRIARLPADEQRAAVEASASASASAPQRAQAQRMTIDLTPTGVLTAVAYLTPEQRRDVIEGIEEMEA